MGVQRGRTQVSTDTWRFRGEEHRCVLIHGGSEGKTQVCTDTLGFRGEEHRCVLIHGGSEAKKTGVY